jgi:hypothetical protein
MTRIALILIITACMFAAQGCNPFGERAAPWYFTAEKYVFIEYRIEEDGRVIEGEFPPGPMIDFPSYMFDPNRGTLISREYPFAIDDTLKVIVGRSTALRGVAGGGIASSLSAAYQLPYHGEGFSIMRIDREGTAHVRLESEQILVESGEEWHRSTSRIDTVGVGRNRSIAEFTRTHRILNRGLLDKQNIRNW